VSTERLLGEPVAAGIRGEVRERVERIGSRGSVPTLGTVLMSDDPADRRFVGLKHDACERVGIETRDVRIDPGEPASRLYAAVERLSADPDVDAVFVQVPLPDHVRTPEVRERIGPRKDVDCLHPTNLGRLVAGHPRFVPATTAAVVRLLDAYDVAVDGRDVAVVGRSAVIGRPLANRLLQDEVPGNATVTVCHSRTSDLGAVTRRADVVVTAAGVPELVDGSMLAPGAVVVDVSANRRPADTDRGYEVVGDVDVESAREVASAITPVPGGVGPVTLAALLDNVTLAAERRAGEDDPGA
jgi:methylenetetrahydrofolate dehydrogenase (NADP+)/methenyltetrahydrofolate cyclohydrolase